MNASYFCRLFHRSTGLRFTEYVNETRLDEARRRLRQGGESITEIAFASGFQSISQFNRAFRRHLGCTPRQWQRDYFARGGADDWAGSEEP